MIIIEWCNANGGFLSGVLALLTLVVSIVAVIVSIRTARLPYKKRLVLSSDMTMLVRQSNLNGEVVTHFTGITVNATNVGNRNVNISHLGFAIVKEGKLQIMQPITHQLGGTGILRPTEVATATYTPKDMLGIRQNNSRTKVYCYARDTEGTIYKRYYARIGKITKIIKESFD